MVLLCLVILVSDETQRGQVFLPTSRIEYHDVSSYIHSKLRFGFIFT